jgi:hypothetical protein
MDFNRYRTVWLPLVVKFVDKCSQKFFGGSFPQNASPQLIAAAILEGCPLFADASSDVREHCLTDMAAVIHYKMIEQDAADAMNSTEWLS